VRVDRCDLSYSALEVEDGIIADDVIQDDVLTWAELWRKLFPDQPDTFRPRSPAFDDPESSTADADMKDAGEEDMDTDD